jgi:hypothetical protein
MPLRAFLPNVNDLFPLVWEGCSSNINFNRVSTGYAYPQTFTTFAIAAQVLRTIPCSKEHSAF